jgi:Cu+-exporting ATPase
MDVLVSLGTLLAFMYSLVVSIVWMIIGLEMPAALATGDGHHGGGHGGSSIAPPPHFFEASAMLLNFIMLGKMIESHAKRKTGESLRELASHWPSEARLASASEESTSVPCDLLQIDDIVAITVGETLPCDGIVTTGDMHVDESILTGEDKPVRKTPGEFLVGGSKCLDGRAEYRATAIGANTAMSQIAKMVEAAQSTKPDIQRVATKVSAVFVPTILGLSLFTFAVWSLLVATELVDVPTALDGSGASRNRKHEWQKRVSSLASSR